MEFKTAYQKLKTSGITVTRLGKTGIQAIFSLRTPDKNGLCVGKDTCVIYWEDSIKQWVVAIPKRSRNYEIRNNLEEATKLVLRLYNIYTATPKKSITEIFEESVDNPDQYLV